MGRIRGLGKTAGQNPSRITWAVVLVLALVFAAGWFGQRAKDADAPGRTASTEVKNGADGASGGADGQGGGSGGTGSGEDAGETVNTGEDGSPNQGETTPNPEQPKPIRAKVGEVTKITPQVSVKVRDVDLIMAEGRGPGELSGESFRVNLELQNTSEQPFDLGTVVVTMDMTDGTPASPIEAAPDAEPLTGMLASGTYASGAYLFLAPEGSKKKFQISFSTSTDEPVVLFKGRATGAAR